MPLHVPEQAIRLLEGCSREHLILKATVARQEDLLERLGQALAEASDQEAAASSVRDDKEFCLAGETASLQVLDERQEGDDLCDWRSSQLTEAAEFAKEVDLPEMPALKIDLNLRSGKRISRNLEPMESKRRSSVKSAAPIVPAIELYGLQQDIEESKRSHSVFSYHRHRHKAQSASNYFLRGAWSVAARVSQSVEVLQEPERRGCFAEFVDGRFFSTSCMAVILFNAAFMIAYADCEMDSLGKGVPSWMETTDRILDGYYVIEMVLKLSVHRLYFFVNSEAGWNIFDLSLVAFSAVENLTRILASVQLEDGTNKQSLSLGFLRIFRICKLAKVLRVFRTLRFFSEMRLMMDCIIGSFTNLFWCLAMMLFVMYVFALIIVQGLAGFLIVSQAEGEGLQKSYEDDVFEYFGSVGTAIVTLFQSTTSGVDWRDAFMLLVVSGWELPVVFVVFICIFTISVWNIVTSTFVEKAMKLAKPDMDGLVLEQNVQAAKESAELEQLFRPFATETEDGSLEICLKELQVAITQSRFRSALFVRGIDIKNLEVFFEMLSSLSEDGGVDLRTLVNACVRMKGFATSIDLQSLGFESKRMHLHLASLSEANEAALQEIKATLHGLLCSSGRQWMGAAADHAHFGQATSKYSESDGSQEVQKGAAGNHCDIDPEEFAL